MMKKHVIGVLKHILLVVYLLFTLFPFYWFFSLSVKTTRDVYAQPPVFFPKNPVFDYFRVAFDKYIGYLLNTIIVAIGATALSLVLGTIAAYSFARFKFTGGENLAFWMLSIRMIPPIVAILPIFIMMKTFNLLDTYPCLIFAHTISLLPFVVWLMRGFFLEIPVEIEESAMIDGCSRLGAFLRTVLPLAVPALVTATIFCIIFSFGEYLFALILTRDKSVTIPVVLYWFRGHREVHWQEMSALSTMSIIPMLALFLFIQRHITRGLTFGAVKGR